MLKETISIDELLTETNFDNGSLNRGHKYYLQDRVSKLRISNDARHISSCVSGRGHAIYQVQIHLTDDPANFQDEVQVKGSCSCYVGYNCKHVVATLLEADDHPHFQSPLMHSIPTAGGTTTGSREFNQWFDQFKLSKDGYDQRLKHNKPGHLLYVIQFPYGNKKQLQITLMISNLLKKGGYGKPRAFSSTANSHQAYLQEIDEEIIVALQYINKRSSGSSYSQNSFYLEGGPSSKWLEVMLKTGRCFFDKAPECPLQWGEEKILDYKWDLLPDATQVLELLVDSHPTHIAFLDQAWYIDTVSGQCGLANTKAPLYLVEQLVQAPPVPAEMAQSIIEHIGSIAPKQQDLLPISLNDPINKTAVNCTPEMRLSIENLSVRNQGRGYMYQQPTTVEMAIAEISFDYEGVSVPFSFTNNTASVSYVEKDKVYTLQRDFEKEKEFLLGLNDLMQLKLLEKESKKGKSDKLQITSLENEEDFLEFSLYASPQLESKGWHIQRDHEAFMSVIFEEDISWYSELDDSSSYDYFSFKVGISLDDEQINILPIIADLIRATPVDHFNDLPDDSNINLPLPNGKILAVPFSRIKPMLNLLVELYDTKVNVSDGIQLSRRQAALLFEIEKAFQASQMRWFGGEKLRQLGKKIAGFESIRRVSPPKTFKATLRDYQQQGVDWLQFLREYQLGGVLADDMGLGKTVQTLAHLSIEKNTKRIKKPCLIIAPTSLMVNWRLEAERFTPNLKVLVFHGDTRHQQQSVFTDYDIILTTYPLLVRDKEVLLDCEYYYLILDEAQFIKNHNAKSTQIVQQLHAEHRLCLTGTPMENHLGELWSLFHFLMPGFLGDLKQFKTVFRTPIEKHADDDRRKGLALRIKPFMLRRQKNAVMQDLPEKTLIVRTVELQGPERDLYESIRLSMERKVRDAIKSKGVARSHIIILDALLKLRQTCCHPRLLKLAAAKKAHKFSAKLTLLKEMLPTMVEEGRKILLFSQFTSMLKIIEEVLQAEGLEYVKLTGSTKDRATPVESFQQGKVPIFLISLKAGGTGLNLTAADTIIHYDPWWNPAVEDQATDRAHRIGQKKSVFVYKLLAAGTVEETIQEMQQKKRQLMAGILSEQPLGKVKLSAADLENLFKPLSEDN